MQSLSRLLSIEASVIAGRSAWRAFPHAYQLHTNFSTRQRRSRRSIAVVQQNGASPDANSPTPAPAPTDPPPSTAAFGQVMAAQANFVRIKIDRLEGSDAPPPQPRLLCVVRALLKKIKQEVLVGDRVRVVGIDWTDGRGMVDEVLPRSTRLSEPPVANVNHVLLVFSSAMPPLQPSAATRYLVAAEAAGLPITVVLNKADLMSEEEAAAEENRVARWGYAVVSVSVVDERGLDELEKVLKEKVTVVAGPSGAGKSSIINALRLRAAGVAGTLDAMAAQPSGWQAAQQDEEYESEEEVPGSGEAVCEASAEEMVEREGEVEGSDRKSGTVVLSAGPGAAEVAGVELQAVGSISERIGRGKHTTRNVMLVEMGSGGLLVDTPGFNQPTVTVPPSELGGYFPEVRAALEQSRCSFSNCQHISEPGCVVRGDWERYELYTALHAELQGVEEETTKRAAGKRQREGNLRMKSRGGGKMGMEAKLVTKSHRRVSRRSVKQELSDLVRDVEDDEIAPPS